MLRSDAATTWLEQAISQRMYVAKAKGKRLKRPAPGRVPMLLPIGLEADYEAYISSLLKRIAAAGEPWVPAEGERLDATAPPGWERSMAAMREAQRKIMEEQSGNVYAMVAKFGQSTAEWNRKQWTKQLKPYVGVDLYPPGDPLVKQTVESWSNENLSRIKSLGSQQIEALNETMMAATRAGTNMRDIRKELQRTNATFTKWRAELLARDQMGKLNGSLTRTRSTAAGISKYIWRGILDQRERASHAALEGKSRSWNEGGITPGEEILCRCTSEPELDDIWTKCEEDVYGEPPVPEAAAPNPKIAPRAPVAVPSTERRMPAPKPGRTKAPETPNPGAWLQKLLDERAAQQARAFDTTLTPYEKRAARSEALKLDRRIARLAGGEDIVPNGFTNADPDTKRYHEAAWKNAPEWMKKALYRADKSFAGVTRLDPTEIGKYHAETAKMELGGAGFGPDDMHTWRHEFGHHLDAARNENPAHWVGSGSETRTLDADVRKWQSAAKYTTDINGPGYERWTPEYAAEAAKELGVSVKNLERFAAEQWGDGEFGPKVARVLKALVDGSPEEFAQRFTQLRRDLYRAKGTVGAMPREAGQFHDMLHASSKEQFGFGHPKGYYKTSERRGAEMFAQFVSLNSSKNAEVWGALIRRLWPELSEKFTEAIVKYGEVK